MNAKPTMKAVIFERYGGPERLSLREVPVPAPSMGDVRVKVHATTVNRTDTATLRAHPFFARAMTGLFRPKMPTLGLDFAGVVQAPRTGAYAVPIGDPVFPLSPHVFGAHAEYLCVPAGGAIARVPGDLVLEHAVVGEGAWYANGTTKLLSEGMRCLIYGASGAIGTAAVQLAKVAGAEVMAVVGTRHLGLAERLGADQVVNYETEDFTAIDGQFDVVFDAVGKTSYFECKHLLKTDGVFSATDLGPAWSNIFLGTFYGLTGSGRVRVPFPEDPAGFLQRLAELMAQGRFRGVFDRSYPIDDIESAFRYVETGQKTGIVVINVN